MGTNNDYQKNMHNIQVHNLLVYVLFRFLLLEYNTLNDEQMALHPPTIYMY